MTSAFAKTVSLLAASSALALTACGGGGDASSTSNPGSTTLATTSISSTNAKDVGAQAYSASTSLNTQISSDANTAMVTGVSVTTAPTTLLGSVLNQVQFAFGHLDNGMVTGVAINNTVNCPQGGTLTVGGNIANAAGPSNGDTISLTANACVSDGTKVNGGMSIVLSNISGSLDTGATGTLTLAATLNNFAVTANGVTESATGNFTIALTQAGGTEAFIASGNTLQLHTVRGATTTDRTLKDFKYSGSVNSNQLYTYNANYTLAGNLPKLGNVDYTVRTTTDFKQQPGSFPTQGVITVTAADKSSVTLTTVSNVNVTLGIDKNGDGTIDETINTTWAELASLF